MPSRKAATALAESSLMYSNALPISASSTGILGLVRLASDPLRQGLIIQSLGKKQRAQQVVCALRRQDWRLSHFRALSDRSPTTEKQNRKKAQTAACQSDFASPFRASICSMQRNSDQRMILRAALIQARSRRMKPGISSGQHKESLLK